MINKAGAEDPLEALKLELSLISSQMEDLRLSLLSPEVRSLAPADAGIALLRLDAMEAKLRSTVGRVEALEFHLEILSKDAANRISEFSAKLQELESPNQLKVPQLSAEDRKVEQSEGNDEGLSNETLAFDEAILSFNSQDYEEALLKFKSFNNQFPQSINIAEAFYWLGKTNQELAFFKEAASAFLESFSLAPKGIFAWKSLLGLAASLGGIGQIEQGCLTIGELRERFPESVSKNEGAVLSVEKQLKCSS